MARTHAEKMQQFNDQVWTTCGCCLGRFVDKRLFIVSGQSICAWCSTRGGKVQILFIKFVSQFSDRACEYDLYGPGEKCKCAPCTARVIMQYRSDKSHGQVAPIIVR